MVNKTFALAAALALIAGSVKASAAMDNLIETVNTNLSADGLIMLIYNQIYNFIIVLAAGPVYSLLDFLYNNFTFPLALDDLGITGLPFNLILTFVGIGNFDQFVDVFYGIVQKALLANFVDQVAAFGFLADYTITYDETTSNVIDLINLDDISGGALTEFLPGYVSTGDISLITTLLTGWAKRADIANWISKQIYQKL